MCLSANVYIYIKYVHICIYIGMAHFYCSCMYANVYMCTHVYMCVPRYTHTPQVMLKFFLRALQSADHRLTPSSAYNFSPSVTRRLPSQVLRSSSPSTVPGKLHCQHLPSHKHDIKISETSSTRLVQSLVISKNAPITVTIDELAII